MIYYLTRNLVRNTILLLGIGVSSSLIVAGNLAKSANSIDKIQQAKEHSECFSECKKHDLADTLMAYNTCINSCEMKYEKMRGDKKHVGR